jgi:LuxR family maltose regulon positive regulatory protein
MTHAFPALAKLSRPRLFDVLPRQRLFEALDQALERSCLWIYGPPGAGKTALVASFLEGRARDGIWYQVDDGDRDVSAFFYYLGLAAPSGDPPLPLLTPEYLADTPSFTRRFFRLLCARYTAPALIVLDNYQHLGAETALHRLIATAIGELPDHVHLIVVSREPPPQAFAVNGNPILLSLVIQISPPG